MINDRKNWSYGLYINNNWYCWYSDGSVRDKRAALGIHNPKLNINLGKRISDHSTIMQAEIHGIKECILHCLRKNCKGENIVILTDSQAAIKALGKNIIYSKTVASCVNELNKLGNDNRITIGLVPGHSRIRGNDMADELAVGAINHNTISINTLLPSDTFENRMKEKYKQAAKIRWNTKTDDMTHAKKYIRGFEAFKAKFLLNRNRTDMRILTGLLTGHALTNSFLLKCKKKTSALFRCCFEEKETVAHWLEECAALSSRRDIWLNWKYKNKKDIHYNSLLKFAKYYKDTIHDAFTNIKTNNEPAFPTSPE